MRLYTNKASPFARKVRVLVREAGLTRAVEEIEMAVSPVSPNETLARDNPLIKIPALTTDDGTSLYDSPVICEYLDAQHAGRRFFPSGDARYVALRRQALADGMLDAAVLCRYESAVRPEQYRWKDWIEGQKRKIFTALDALEGEASTFGDAFDIGHIAIACALGYFDFRFPD